MQDITKTIRLLAILAIFVLPGHSQACPPTAADFTSHRWCVEISGTVDADVDQPDAGAEIVRVTRMFDATLIHRQSQSLDLYYDYTSLELDDDVAANMDLHRLALRYHWQRTGLDGTTRLRLQPGIATSSNRFADVDVDHNDRQIALALTHTRQSKLAMGITYDQRLGRSLLYPTLRGEVRLRGSWVARPGIPDASVSLDRQPWRLTFYLRPAGGRWHMLDADSNRRFDVSLRRWEVAGSLQRTVGARFAWHASIGYAFARRIDFTAHSGRRIESGLEPALYATIGVRLRNRGRDY